MRGYLQAPILDGVVRISNGVPLVKSKLNSGRINVPFEPTMLIKLSKIFMTLKSLKPSRREKINVRRMSE